MEPHERRHEKRPGAPKDLLRGESVRHVMSSNVVRVPKNASVGDALAAMREKHASCVLVEDAGRLAGIFTERDNLDKIAGHADATARPIAEVMSASPKHVAPDASLGEVLRVAVEGGYRHLPVVEDGRACGLVVALDLVKFVAGLFPTEVYNLPPHLNQVMPRTEGA